MTVHYEPKPAIQHFWPKPKRPVWVSKPKGAR